MTLNPTKVKLTPEERNSFIGNLLGLGGDVKPGSFKESWVSRAGENVVTMPHTLFGIGMSIIGGLTEPTSKIVRWLAPKGDQEHKATGFNRVRQLLTGSRLPGLADKYMNTLPGVDRDDIMKELMRENTHASRMWLMAPAATVGAAIGTPLLGMWGAKKLGDKIIDKGVEHLAKSKEEKTASKIKSLDAISNKYNLHPMIAEGLRRTMGNKEEYDKLTLDDLTTALRDTALTAGSVYGTHHAGGILPKLLGVQEFYHGTTPENVKNILQHGLDPAYGGIKGGAAERLQTQARLASKIYSDPMKMVFNQHTINRYKDMESSTRQIRHVINTGMKPDAKDSTYHGRGLFAHGDLDDVYSNYMNMQPHLDVAALGLGIPIDTTNFRDNAVGRVYVTPSRADALSYGLVTTSSHGAKPLPRGISQRLGVAVEGLTNPKSAILYEHTHKDMHPYIKDVKDNIGKVKIRYNDLVKKYTDIEGKVKIPKREELKVVGDVLQVFQSLPKFVNEQILNPPIGRSSVVGGALPFNQFHNRFETDPENIYPRAAFRSKRVDSMNNYQSLLEKHPDQVAKIDPKYLSVNKPSISNIWNARSRGSDWFKYVKENPGRFSQGVGMMGLNTLLAAHTIKNDYIPIVQKMLGKYKVKQDATT